MRAGLCVCVRGVDGAEFHEFTVDVSECPASSVTVTRKVGRVLGISPVKSLLV